MKTNEHGWGEVAPMDDHNRRLLAHVHPGDWSNPRPAARYHLVVVGGGTAGLVTAAIAAALGARVALVERHLLGGDCLNTGCVPSKAILAAAHAWHGARAVAWRFGGPTASGDGDFALVMQRMRELRAEISAHDSARRFSDLGVDVFIGNARFDTHERIVVDEVGPLHFRRAIIATGARAAVPPIPGLGDAGPLTNETVFSLTTRPNRLAVVGGGPIGCELAQAFARLGSQVTVLEGADRILLQDDADAAEVVRQALQRDGIRIESGAKVSSVRRDGSNRVVAYETASGRHELACDELLIATGRTPNVSGLALEAGGIRYEERTGVVVDDHMRTSNKRVFAIGDVASRFQFTHAADAQARLVVRNALFRGRASASKLVIPWCTYTQPELAHVGPPARELRAQADGIEQITVRLEDLDRARVDGRTEGFLRVYLKKGGDRIVAATLVGVGAGDIITQLTQAMALGIPLSRLGDVIAPYPTYAELIRKAADQYRRRKLTPRAQWLFKWYFKVLG